MCFSANADFAAAAGLTALGVATLRHVDDRGARLLAAMPLLFALHQAIEGFVWLAVHGRLPPGMLGPMTFLYVLHAEAALPLLMPLAVLLVEPRGRRHDVILGLTGLGGALGLYVLYALVAFPTNVFVAHRSLAYRNPGTESDVLGGIYVVAVCGALLVSSHRWVRRFGYLNLIGVVATLLVKEYAFTSVWCFYAAVCSVVLYLQVRAGDAGLAAAGWPRLAPRR